jgi:hypothetical protein
MTSSATLVGWSAPVLARWGGLSSGRGRGGGYQFWAFLAAHPVTTCGAVCLALGGFLLYAFRSDWETRRDWRRAEAAVRTLIAASLGICGWGALMVVAGLVSGR